VAGKRVILRLLAAGREVCDMVVSPRRAVEMRAILDTGHVQPGARVWFIASDRDDDAGRLDAGAGCEFVDDRIRLLE
jgi:hypothetical protein